MKLNRQLSRDLIRMGKEDQKVRVGRKPEKIDVRTMRKVDEKNLQKMKVIVKKYGWPTIDKVGKNASQTAWLTIQHAGTDILFQKYCLRLMRIEAKFGKVSNMDVAYLIDRILMIEGKPQIYGTQYSLKKGKLSIWPIKNLKLVDKKRKQMRLSSLRAYDKKMKTIYSSTI